jgi:hypothetical protein
MLAIVRVLTDIILKEIVMIRVGPVYVFSIVILYDKICDVLWARITYPV